jgi:hypothetical protein
VVQVAYSVGLIQLGVLFSVAGLAKSLDRVRFTAELSAQGLLPTWARGPTARLVPAVELLLGVWLVSGVRFRPTAACAAVLLVVFVAYRIALRALGPRGAPCGCLGSAKTRLAERPDAEVVGLMLNLAVAVLIAASAPAGSNRYGPAVAVGLAALTIGGMVAVAVRRRRAFRRFAGVAVVPDLRG